MKKLQRQLFKLLRLHSPSGKEGGVRKYIVPALQATMDTVRLDGYGNILAEKKYGDSGYTVLLSAHMDTVASVQPNPTWRKNKTEIFTTSGSALGGDDKCGLAAHMAVIRELNKGTKFTGTIKVLFSREEEIGCVGASQAVKLSPEWFQDIDASIVIDRRGGDDIVTGCWSERFCSDEYGAFWEVMGTELGITSFKPRATDGSISDTMIFSELGINGVNLSAGYYEPHSKNEYIKIHELKRTVRWVTTALDHIEKYTFPSFEYVMEYKHDYKYDYKYLWKGNTKSSVWDKDWVVCDWCRMEWTDAEMIITSQGEHICPDCQDYEVLDDEIDSATFECAMCGQDKPIHEYIDYRGFDLCAGCCLMMDVAVKEVK